MSTAEGKHAVGAVDGNVVEPIHQRAAPEEVNKTVCRTFESGNSRTSKVMSRSCWLSAMPYAIVRSMFGRYTPTQSRVSPRGISTACRPHHRRPRPGGPMRISRGSCNSSRTSNRASISSRPKSSTNVPSASNPRRSFVSLATNFQTACSTTVSWTDSAHDTHCAASSVSGLSSCSPHGSQLVRMISPVLHRDASVGGHSSVYHSPGSRPCLLYTSPSPRD